MSDSIVDPEEYPFSFIVTRTTRPRASLNSSSFLSGRYRRRPRVSSLLTLSEHASGSERMSSVSQKMSGPSRGKDTRADFPIFVATTSHEEFHESRKHLCGQVYNVLCERQNPGWKGALNCNIALCARAIDYFESRGERDGVYISLEAYARPSMRFCRHNLERVLEALCDDVLCVYIAVLPTPFNGYPRKAVSPCVFRQSGGFQPTTAIACTTAFARLVLRSEINEPFDVYLNKFGISSYVMYPAAFQRGSGISLSTVGWKAHARKIIEQPHLYCLAEFFCHYSGALSVLLISVLVLILVNRVSPYVI